MRITKIAVAASIAALVIGLGLVSSIPQIGSSVAYAAAGGQAGDNSTDHGVGGLGSGGHDGNGGGGGGGITGGGGGGGSADQGSGAGGSDGTDSSGGLSGR